MKPSIDNLGYAVVALSMLVLSIAAVAEHARMPPASARVFEREAVTIVAARGEPTQAHLAMADAAEPATPTAQ